MRFGLVDDHNMVREGFKALLEEEASSWEVVLESDSYEAALTSLLSLSPNLVDFLIVDISLPDKNGLLLAKYVKEAYPDIKLIILSMYEETSYINRAISIGVDGYLSKRDASVNLVDAVRQIIAGETYFSASVAKKRNAKSKVAIDEVSLTPREVEIFNLLAKGYNAKKVAKELNIMPKTAHVHRTKIMKKFGFLSQIEVTKLALEKGMISVDEII